MRVDEASHEKKRRETLLLLVYSFLLLFFVLLVTLFVLFCSFCFYYFPMFCFGFITIFILTYCYIREKLHNHSDASIFFPLYVGPPVRTTAAPGRFFRSLTFPDDLKGLNRVLRTALAYNNFFKI